MTLAPIPPGGAPPVRDEDLHAYVDDQLDPDRRSLVERYLEQNPEAARRVTSYQAQRAAIRAAFQQQGSRPLPRHLTVAGILAQRARKRATRRWLVAACLVLAVLGGGAGGWLLHAPPDLERGERAMLVLEQQALASHAVYSVDSRHPVEVPGSEDRHLQQWFSNRLHRVVVVPDLSGLGFHLIGGRLLATEHGDPAALLMYEDAEHHRMSVVLRPMGPALRMPSITIGQDGVNGLAWINDGMGVAVVAALPEPNLAAVANQISSAMHPTG